MIRTAPPAAAGLLAAVTLLAAQTLVACSSGSGTAGAPPAAATSAPANSLPPSAASDPPSAGAASRSPAEAFRTVAVTVAGRRVRPAPGQVAVRVGERLRITVTADAANQVHVHGVDVERDLAPDQPVSLVVAYDQPGVYEVELHDPALLLFQVAVR